MNNQLYHFDPDFDDTAWIDNWSAVETAKFPTITHPSGYCIDQITVNIAKIFDNYFRLSCPFTFSRLTNPDGRVLMSNSPQELIMMYNNAKKSKGHILVGGLGLGTYLQYAQITTIGKADRFTIIEKSEIVVEMVLPIIEKLITVPIEIIIDNIESFLLKQGDNKYDTIFIDTWDKLDAVQLPKINSLRNLSTKHIEKEGNLLLWGYHWMVRIFENACRYILKMSPEIRKRWLVKQEDVNPEAIKLLIPIINHCERHGFNKLDEKIKWCRDYIVKLADN